MKKNELYNILESYKDAIDLLIYALADHTIVLMHHHQQCSTCENSATVMRHILGTLACDRCAAESICASMSNEDDWRDLPQAESLRRIITHYEMIDDSEGILPPLNKRN